MPNQPLEPFGPPTALFTQLHIPTTLGSAQIITWVLYAVFAFWLIYSFVAIYHWLKYSHASWVAVPAIAIHIFVSFALMSYALSGHTFFFTYLP